MVKQSRTNESGRAYAESQRQIQTYVNWHEEALSSKILDTLPSLSSLNPSIQWVSPLEKENLAIPADNLTDQEIELDERTEQYHNVLSLL